MIVTGLRSLALLIVISSAIALSQPVKLTNCSLILKSGGYVLTRDINTNAIVCMVIAASDVVLDCQGHVIEGKGLSGIIVGSEVKNVTVRNCILRYWEYGIYLYGVDFGVLEGNEMYNCYYGIRLEYGLNNTIMSNTITTSDEGYGIYLIGSHLNSLKNNRIVGFDYGIELDDSTRNTIQGNYVCEADWEEIYLDSDSHRNSGENICDEIKDYGRNYVTCPMSCP